MSESTDEPMLDMAEPTIPPTNTPRGWIGTGKFYIYFPVKKTTANEFSAVAVSEAAQVALYESLPAEWEIVDRGLIVVERNEGKSPVNGEDIFVLTVLASVRKKGEGSAPE